MPAFDFHADAFGQDARDVVNETAARDVRETFDRACVEQCFERGQVTQVRCEQRFADSHAEFFDVC